MLCADILTVRPYHQFIKSALHFLSDIALECKYWPRLKIILAKEGVYGSM